MAALLGVDFGGTKIEAAALAPGGGVLARERAPNPRTYDDAIALTRDLVAAVASQVGAAADAPVGVGIPGSVSPATGLIRNANSTWLNGRDFAADMGAALGRRVRMANDANCFALSESVDGAAAGMDPAFGVILGTGCGGGVVTGGALVQGANHIVGEWGHTPLPWPAPDEYPGPECWCGKRGCLETWLCGPAMTADHRRATGQDATPDRIAEAAGAGDEAAAATLERYAGRLARGLAVVANLLDPAVIVLGGGVSNIAALYDGLSDRIAQHAFADSYSVRVLPARHGDSSGVRGAAWLWKDAA